MQVSAPARRRSSAPALSEFGGVLQASAIHLLVNLSDTLALKSAASERFTTRLGTNLKRNTGQCIFGHICCREVPVPGRCYIVLACFISSPLAQESDDPRAPCLGHYNMDGHECNAWRDETNNANP